MADSHDASPESKARSAQKAASQQARGHEVSAPTSAGNDPLELLRAPEPPKESPKKALTQLGIVAAVAAVALGAYGFQMKRTFAVKTLVSEALPLIEKSDVASLRAAQAKYDEAIERGGSDQALTGAAEVYALLWVEHGFADAKDGAIAYSRDAASKGIENSQRFLAEALVAVGQGKPEEGKRVVDAVVARGASSERLFFGAGVAELALGNARGAKDRFKRAHEMKSQVPHYARWYGDAADDANDPKAASFAWETAAKANPAYVQGVARDIIARLRRGEDRKGTAAALTKLAALKPEELGPQGQAAVAYAQATEAYIEGKPMVAKKLVDSAIALGGETSRHLYLRGLLGKDGKDDLEKAQARTPLGDRYLFGLADYYVDAGKPEDAVKLLTAAQEKRGEDAALHVALGHAWIAKGDFGKAKASLDKALSLEADSANALLGLAVLGWKQKKYDEALPYFEKAIMANPKFPELYEAIGLMYAEQGDLTRGNAQLDMSEKLFRANEVDTPRTKRFYDNVQKTYGAAKKGGAALAKDWGTREKAFRDGTQPALE